MEKHDIGGGKKKRKEKERRKKRKSGGEGTGKFTDVFCVQ